MAEVHTVYMAVDLPEYGDAGTVQAFVPVDMLDQFKANIESNLGQGSCHVLNIRTYGGIRVQ